MPISVTNEHNLSLKTDLLTEIAAQLLDQAQLANAHVDVLLTDDATVRELNCRYRGLDKPTDVLSFAQQDHVEGAPQIPSAPGLPIVLGDVVISVDTALKQSIEHEVSLDRELALLTVHGILHLIGYEDESEAGARRMHAREKELLGFTFPAAALPV